MKSKERIGWKGWDGMGWDCSENSAAIATMDGDGLVARPTSLFYSPTGGEFEVRRRFLAALLWDY